ncbi:NAD(P)-binding protein [Auriscalpium vulgare]|uniref:NAD(P)-binding protein n=1 Tax=Auriscalpium vulgare TaxID=40419 RepID=A0ACB8R8Q0_9AGAM|nr:NAD(P)-binding protein [Auriscalpium vulgare]
MSSVLLLGGTGYIGCSVLVSLRAKYPALAITALVRNPAHVHAIRATGASVVEGSLNDAQLVEEQVYAHDVVINAADSEDVKLTEAILRAARRRSDEGKKKSVFIHTSGVGLFMDGSREGKFDEGGKVWNDAKEDDIKSISSPMMHAEVDIAILQAGEEGYVNTYIICPAGVVGPPRGPFQVGSFFTRNIVQFCIAMKQPTYVGEGTNEVDIVDLDDTVDLYSAHIGPRAQDREATHERSIVIADLENPPIMLFVVAASARVVADRPKDLGWKARPVNLEDYVKADLDIILQ